MASVPEKLPATVGAKRSWTWQLATGDRVPQSCPMTLKGAAGAQTCDTTRGAFPPLSKVATRLPLPPTATLPKPRLAGTPTFGSVAAPPGPSNHHDRPEQAGIGRPSWRGKVVRIGLDQERRRSI